MIRRFKADVKELESVLSYIHSFVSDTVSKKILMKIDVSVEEIFVNISKYAYKIPGYVDIDVNVDTSIKITFIDEGIKFNPLEKENPDINLSSEERKIGGLGIYMTKKMMDNVDYIYKDNKNILTIEKNIESR